MATMKGVFLSGTLDLAAYYAEAFVPYSETVQLLEPGAVSDPEAIEFALCWCPEDQAFTPYPNLRLVSSIAAGVDNILACPSLPSDITLLRIRDDEQAKHMTGFALWHVIGAHREMGAYRQQQEQKIWQKVPYKRAEEISVAILGFGLMGSMLAEALVALGYRVTVLAKRARADIPAGVRLVTEAQGKEAAVKRAEIVVNLLPATADTQGILDAGLMHAMAPGGTLINLGRGNHLVEADLLAMLETGHLAGAALDVTAIEPLPEDHIFWRHPKIALTPHVAAETTATTLAKLVSEDIARFQAGTALRGLVDQSRAY